MELAVAVVSYDCVVDRNDPRLSTLMASVDCPVDSAIRLDPIDASCFEFGAVVSGRKGSSPELET